MSSDTQAPVPSGRIITDLASVADASYDFIVVGGGVGGSVMAGVLSQSSNKRVLLIEAGQNDTEFPATAIPLLAPTLMGDPRLFWNTAVVPQTGLRGRAFPFHRGKILGGGSTINMMIINKGAKSYWDRLARITEDPGWSYDALKKEGYLNKFETLVSPTSKDLSLEKMSIPEIHGTSGPIYITPGNWKYGMDDPLLAAIPQVDGFEYNPDVNSGDQIGVSYGPTANGGGVRSSAANYLRGKNITKPEQLDILVRAQVIKLIFAPSKEAGNATPRVVGVEYTAGPTDETRKVYATHEVVVSGGCVGSPHLLMLSGIGDKEALAAHGIESHVHLPDVGKNLQDHPLVLLSWAVNSKDTFDDLVFNPTTTPQLIGDWSMTHSGILSHIVGSFTAWTRLPDSDPIFEKYPDPSAGGQEPHCEMAFGAGYFGTPEFPAPSSGNYLTVAHEVAQPMSRGSVTLLSSDPFTEPNFDLGLLTHPLDRHVMAQTIKDVRRFLAAPAWDGFIQDPWGNHTQYTTDEEIDELISKTGTTAWHGTSSLAMSSLGASYGVLNPDLTVKGVSGLSVVDGSVFPEMPSGHPQGFIYILAERAAVLALERAAKK